MEWRENSRNSALDNLPHFLLGFTENSRPALLALSENGLTRLRMHLQTSSSAHNH